MPTPFFSSPLTRLYHVDAIDLCRELAARIASGEEQPIEALITDPPAGIDFMGRRWDKSNPATHYQPPLPARSKKHLRDLQERHAFVLYWAERFAAAYDCLTPDGLAIVWAIPRTADWTMEALRLSGFFIRDVIVHIQAQGWPKSQRALRPLAEHWIVATKTQASLELNVNAVRVPRGSTERTQNVGMGYGGHEPVRRTNGSTDGGRPGNVIFSHDEMCQRVGARKVAANGSAGKRGTTKGLFKQNGAGTSTPSYAQADGTETIPTYRCVAGCETCGKTWLTESGGPAPRCECGAPGVWCCPVAEVDAQGGIREPGGSAKSGKPVTNATSLCYSPRTPISVHVPCDFGGPSRYYNHAAPFRFVGKCGTSERHFGCEELYWRANPDNPFGFDQVSREQWEALGGAGFVGGVSVAGGSDKRPGRQQKHEHTRGNVHPTVKPLGLMLHLVKLSGAKRVLDLCTGSGATAIACWMLGVEFIGAEYCIESCVIAKARLEAWQRCTPQAVDEFVNGGDLPQSEAVDDRQIGLFDRRNDETD